MLPTAPRRLLLVAMIVVAVWAAPVAAEGPVGLGCDDAIHDPDHRLEDVAEVQRAVDALRADGYDPRVRIESIDGSLDPYVERLEHQCPGWQDEHGERAPSRILVVVSPNARQTGIWYGADVGGDLEARWERIQTNEMNPAFKAGRWDDGLAGGLDAIRRAVDATPSTDRSSDVNPLVDLAPMWIGLVGVAAVAFALVRRSNGLDTADTPSRGWVSRPGRYRSSSRRSFGSSSRRSFGGGSRGGGSRRSGGGSTRW